jgi:hypothetical protein
VSTPTTLRYGQVNLPLAQRWLSLAPAEDGPFLAVNLMRYRPRAEYADGRASELSGREADDAYAPLGPLMAVGANLIFVADVVEQPAGEPRFERLGIVRYPTRASFLEMQRREDFQELHVHKDAGMEFTIIFAAALPSEVGGDDPDGPLVLRLRRLVPGAPAPVDPDGVVEVMHLEVEDVMIGDERRWDDARIDRVRPDALAAALADDADGVEEQIAIVLGTPLIDALATAAAPSD